MASRRWITAAFSVVVGLWSADRLAAASDLDAMTMHCLRGIASGQPIGAPQGWSAVPAADLSDPVIDLLTLNSLQNRLGTKTTPDLITSAWDLSRRNASGLTNLKPVEGWPKRVFAVSAQSGSVADIRVWHTDGETRSSCTVTLSESPSETFAGQVTAQIAMPDNVLLMTGKITPTFFEAGDHLDFTVFDVDQLRQAIPDGPGGWVVLRIGSTVAGGQEPRL